MKIDESIKTLQGMYDVSDHPMSEISMEEAEAINIAISAMQELQEYRKLGTLEEVREAVEKQADCKHCGYKIHSENISKLNSCNDCRLKSTCKNARSMGNIAGSIVMIGVRKNETRRVVADS